MMNFERAFKELMNGKKIRRKEWEPLMHLRLLDGLVKTYKGEYTNFYSDTKVLTSKGWKIVEGDGEELSFIQALEELKLKKQLTHKDWEESKVDRFIFVDKDQIAVCTAVEFQFMPTYKCLCSSDWEIMK